MMKKNLFVRIIALMLVLCAVVPVTAMASDTYYLEISIAEQDDPAKAVVSESAGYLLDTELLVPVVVTAVNERYNDGSLRRVFQSPAMEQIMLEGLSAYKSSDAAWKQYWNKYYDKVSNLDDTLPLKEMLTDMDTPAVIGELEVDREYQIKFVNEVVGDRKFGVTYIVTVVRREYSSADGPTIANPDITGVSDVLNTDEHIVYMIGDDNGNFRPDDSISRAEVATIFYRLLRDKDIEITARFSDIADGEWYAEAANTLGTLGIFKGEGDNKFNPARPITRAEFIAVASRFAKPAKGGMTFVDVPEDHWALGNIETAAAYGWTNGVGGNCFNPDSDITRAEAVAIVNRMLGRLGDISKIDAGNCRQFPDVAADHWARYNIAEATTEHDYTFNVNHSKENWIG